MNRTFLARVYRIAHRLYSFLFFALSIYTIGYIIFVMFDHNETHFWASYWSIAKYGLLLMILLQMIGTACRAAFRNAE
jgi:hypothetical protein